MENDGSGKMLPRLVVLLKRHLDDWVENMLMCPEHVEFNKSHFTLLMSIGTHGISNNELAGKLNISKQAASKVVKDLESINLVRSIKSGSDARAVTLYLTEQGISFYTHFLEQVNTLEHNYKKLVGAKNYETAINVLIKINGYHDKLSKP